MHGGQFDHDLVQCQVALRRQPILQAAGVRGRFAIGMVALRLWKMAPARVSK